MGFELTKTQNLKANQIAQNKKLANCSVTDYNKFVIFYLRSAQANLLLFHGCWLKTQAPWDRANNFITQSPASSMNYIFVLVPDAHQVIRIMQSGSQYTVHNTTLYFGMQTLTWKDEPLLWKAHITLTFVQEYMVLQSPSLLTTNTTRGSV